MKKNIANKFIIFAAMYRSNVIHKLLFKQVLLAMYLCFFVAQATTFNSDVAGKFATTSVLSFQKSNDKANKNASINDTGSEKHRQSNIRLNKRFQPEKWVFENVPMNMLVAFAPITTKPIFFYHNGFVPSFLFVVQTLRGPPVVA
jgi:hypothetical protein